MRDVFGAAERAQRLKLHTQTSGRSLVAAEFQNNLTRTAVELMLAYINATNSCHSNSADEPFTTPGEEYVRLAAHAQAILLEETGLFKHMMNTAGGSPGHEGAWSRRSRRRSSTSSARSTGSAACSPPSSTATSAARSRPPPTATSAQVNSGERPIIGLNRYATRTATPPTSASCEHHRASSGSRWRGSSSSRSATPSRPAGHLDELSKVVEDGGNVFGQLIETVEHCSLGQITQRLHELVGHFRPAV